MNNKLIDKIKNDGFLCAKLSSIWKDRRNTRLIQPKISEDHRKLAQILTSKYFADWAMRAGTTSGTECALGKGQCERIKCTENVQMY